jgi:hypothetical protein
VGKIPSLVAFNYHFIIEQADPNQMAKEMQHAL